MEFIMIWGYVSFPLHLFTPPRVLLTVLGWVFYHARISILFALVWQRPRKKTKCPQVPPALLSLVATLHSVTHHRQENVNMEREGIWKEQTHLCSSRSTWDIYLHPPQGLHLGNHHLTSLRRTVFFNFLVIFLFPENVLFSNQPSNRNSLVIF